MSNSFKTILLYLKEIHPESATLTEINRDVFPNRLHSSVYRSLTTLVERGYIRKEEFNYTYITDSESEAREQSQLVITTGRKPIPTDLVLPKGLVSKENLRVLASVIAKRPGQLEVFLKRDLETQSVYLEFMAAYFYIMQNSGGLVSQYWWQTFLDIYNEEEFKINKQKEIEEELRLEAKQKIVENKSPSIPEKEKKREEPKKKTNELEGLVISETSRKREKPFFITQEDWDAGIKETYYDYLDKPT